MNKKKKKKKKKEKKAKKKKGEIIETSLPEDMIHHIQSFMNAKQAARTAILSKSWYNAWLTRPTIVLDCCYFRNSDDKFEKFAAKTLQRYQYMDLNIESFRVHYLTELGWIKSMIATAMELGATNVELELPHAFPPLLLPPEMLGSETLARLSVSWGILDGNHFVRCSRLKSLTLKHVDFEPRNHVFSTLTKSCVSLEELSVSSCWHLAVSRSNLNELRKLRRLYLDYVAVDTMFFTDFASRFPYLKDLSIIHCYGFKTIDIATTSLETISYKPTSDKYRIKFDVPNLRKFAFASCSSPTGLSIKGALKEWDFDISLTVSYNFLTNAWLKDLKRLLTSKSKRSRITSLSARLCPTSRIFLEPEGDMVDLDKAEPEVVDPKPLVVVENLRIVDTCTKSSCALLVRLFRICRPKFITHCLHSNDYKHDRQQQRSYWDDAWRKAKSQRFHHEREALKILCKKLMQQLIAPNCGVPDQDTFGRFGLKRVNMEVLDNFGTKWLPIVIENPLDAETTPVVKKRKVRFELTWDQF